jgi:hypothetical protein
MRDVMVATFLKKPEAFIYDLLEPSADERYVDWRRRIESLTYCFKRDCDEIFTWVESNDMSFGDLFVSTNNRAPIIVKMATERRIALETVVVFDKLLAFMKRAAGKVSGEDWVHMYRTITKYAHFVECDVPKMRALVRNTLDNEFPSLRSGRLATSTTTYPRGGAGHANGLILL